MAIVGFIHCIGVAVAVYFFIVEEIAWFGYAILYFRWEYNDKFNDQ